MTSDALTLDMLTMARDALIPGVGGLIETRGQLAAMCQEVDAADPVSILLYYKTSTNQSLPLLT